MAAGIPAEAKYRVQSLERGLFILRELRRANAPVRNQELVSSTGLPKATVSRLLHTLGALGYVRRTDQGSYVLAHGSARSGRAMLSALGLERYADLFADAPGTVYLESVSDDRLVPVCRWSEGSVVAVASGSPAMLGSTDRITAWGGGTQWDAQAGLWWVWTGLCLGAVGSFALTLQVRAERAPTARQLNDARCLLDHAANTMRLDRQP